MDFQVQGIKVAEVGRLMCGILLDIPQRINQIPLFLLHVPIVMPIFDYGFLKSLTWCWSLYDLNLHLDFDLCDSCVLQLLYCSSAMHEISEFE